MTKHQTDRIAWKRALALLGGAGGLAALTVALLTVTDRLVIDDPAIDGNVTLSEYPDTDLDIPGGLLMCTHTDTTTGGLVVSALGDATFVWAETCDGQETNLQIMAADGESLVLLGTGEATLAGGSGDEASSIELDNNGIVATTDGADLRLTDTLLSWTRDGSSWAMGPTSVPRRLLIEPQAADPHHEFLDIDAPVRARSLGTARRPVVTGWHASIDRSPVAGLTPEAMAAFELDLSNRPWTAGGVIVVEAWGTSNTPAAKEVLFYLNQGAIESELGVCDLEDAGGTWHARLTVSRIPSDGEDDLLRTVIECDYITSDQQRAIASNEMSFVPDEDASFIVFGRNTIADDILFYFAAATFTAYTASQENPSIELEVGP